MNYNTRQQLYAVRVGTDGSAAQDASAPGGAASYDRGMLNWHYSANDWATWGTGGPDNNGNVLRAHHWLSGGEVNFDDYAYDNLNRLTAVTGNGMAYFVQSFTYDQWGNRTINQGLTTNSPDINKKDYKVLTATNRLKAPADSNSDAAADLLRYDAVGNLTKDAYTNPAASGAMEYDGDNHMTSAVNGSHKYRYNADGKRVRRIIASQGEFWMVYGIGGELVAEYNASTAIPAANASSKEYGYRNGKLLVLWDDTETDANLKLKWLVQDHLGSTRMELGKDGVAVRRHDYLPFGEELAGAIRNGNGYAIGNTKQKFTEHERDTETGLDFMQARYYSSVQGRFTSPDETLIDQWENDPQSWNLYSYVRNNPLKFTDPFGMWKRVNQDGQILYLAEEGDTITSLASELGTTPSRVSNFFNGWNRVDVGVLFNVTDLVREIDMEKKAIEGFVKEVAEFSIPIIDIPIVNTAGRQVPRYINPFARTQKDLDSLLNIFSKSKHNKEIAEGLIERAKGELAKLRNDPPAGGPRLHHKAEIKAMLDRAKRIIERLKGKAKEEFEKHIKEVEDEAGKH